MKETISYDDFSKLDIRIGTILSAERVEGSSKLLRLMIDTGDEQGRQLVAGIGEVIEDVESLVGQQIPVLVNLKPKKLMGVESQGMILAADDEGKPVLLHPESDVSNGSTVR
ncbi:methionine--tRNA ligase subunit beta [candidate division WWE3 bacterium]|uniref:Methionine--tRNA ligase n=1 Tax=candidate division WWE3 bacterium TaxID=2053526 RepID=A0A955LLF9_UNCKA|nr:methionine--tRNA ligase subunit beta [candidate division WWE3 bacterium]